MRFDALSRTELAGMYEAAAEAVDSLRAMAADGLNPVTAALAGATAVEEWAHFPAGDAVDAAAQCRFFYHAHAAEERADGEHGHFHTFVQPHAAAGDTPSVTHLIGISTDASGRVIRLFTTNRWVTGEAWHDADSTIGMLDRFDMTRNAASSPLDRWVTAVIRMFRPQIAGLLHARDRRIAAFRAAHPDSDVFEDRALQITSEMPVDLLAQIRAIETLLSARSAA